MVVKVESIDQFNAYFHQETFNSLVSVANLAEADLSLFAPTDFCMYCVVLMDAGFGELNLKGNKMHYRAGTIFTMKPGDIVSMDLDTRVRPRGLMLVFRPELIEGTGLGRDFYMFNFFDYDVSEALELNPDERRVAINCFNNINAELQAKDDEFTNHMIRLGIGQLLTSCRRFYDRQFDTKNMHSSDLMQRLDSLLNEYLNKNLSKYQLAQPTVAWCASHFNLTPNYFGDLVKHESNMSAQNYIQHKIVDKAKSLLSNNALDINEISSQLGFNYSNHFTRFFKNKTGMTPSAFRSTL